MTSAELLVARPPWGVGDDAWSQLAERFGLPIEARKPLNSVISFLIIGQNLKYSPATTKAAFRGLAGLSAQFRGGLQKLLEDRVAVNVLTRVAAATDDFFNENAGKTTQSGFAAEIARLEQFEVILQKAAASMHDARPGARSKAAILAMAVKLLDDMHLKYTGKHLERNSKGNSTGREFVAAICKLAGLETGPGSIDDALKEVIKGRRRGGITSVTAS